MSTMRRWAATLVAAAAAGLLGSGPAWGATAQAGTITEIRSAAGAAKCVGLADNGSTANGTRLVLWDCHGHADQQWFRTT